jgi:hypothetical protein
VDSHTHSAMAPSSPGGTGCTVPRSESTPLKRFSSRSQRHRVLFAFRSPAEAGTRTDSQVQACALPRLLHQHAESVLQTYFASTFGTASTEGGRHRAGKAVLTMDDAALMQVLETHCYLCVHQTRRYCQGSAVTSCRVCNSMATLASRPPYIFPSLQHLLQVDLRKGKATKEGLDQHCRCVPVCICQVLPQATVT